MKCKSAGFFLLLIFVITSIGAQNGITNYVAIDQNIRLYNLPPQQKPSAYFPKENYAYRLMSLWTRFAVRKAATAEPNGAELKQDRAYNKYDYSFERVSEGNYYIKDVASKLYIAATDEGGYKLMEKSNSSQPTLFTLVLVKISDDKTKGYFRIESTDPKTQQKSIMTIPEQTMNAKPRQQTNITDNNSQQLFYFEFPSPF